MRPVTMVTIPASVWNMCRGAIFVSLLFMAGCIGSAIFIPCFIVMFAFKLSSAQWIVDTFVSTWMAFACGLFELVLGVNIVIKGDCDLINRHKSALLIMNHPTRLDWIFFLAVQARYGSLSRLKIGLMDKLRHTPGAGWATQAANFIFLKCSWDEDKIRIETALDHFKQFRCRPQLLLYPEGANMQEPYIGKSDAYAKRNGLPIYKYVLHPRTRGFEAIVKYMKSNNALEHVVDVTISYTHNMIQSEGQLFTKEMPREVVFNVKVFDIDNLPTDPDHLSKWLISIWAEKEEYLKHFYESDRVTIDHVEQWPRDADYELEVERETKLHLLGAMLFWLSILVIFIVLFVWSSWIRWIYLFTTIGLLSLSTFIGFDHLLAALRK